jgi:hypothetical protein
VPGSAADGSRQVPAGRVGALGAGMGSTGNIERRMRQADVLTCVAEHITTGDVSRAVATCRERLVARPETIRFPLARPAAVGQATGAVVPRATVGERLRVATRDGFVDRYSAERWRLVNPGALRVISLRVGGAALPTKVSAGTVRAYAGNAPVWWDLWPTVDHRVPWSRGGSGDADNLICTSWWRNDTKQALSTEETGWQVHEPGDVALWNGLSRWFLAQVDRDPTLLGDPMVASYHRATRPLFPAAPDGASR